MPPAWRLSRQTCERGSTRIRGRSAAARLLTTLLAGAIASVALACGSPPQVLEISPQRGANDVASDDPVRVHFDRPMDHASVAAHFRVEPRVQGTVTWSSDRDMAFEHVPFEPSTQYQVVMEPGYRDANGAANPLRHSWSFRTESPPTLSGASPGSGDRDIDPAAYLTLTFSRAMDEGSLSDAISLSPATPFTIHQDGTDPRRVVLAPQTLLEPHAGYTVTVGRDAKDVDGNRLAGTGMVSFSTGSFRPLRHWVSFIAEAAAGSGGLGVWIVDDNRVPRRLVSNPVSSFTWSDDGTRLLLRDPSGAWTDQPLDGAAARLPIQADWADFLAPGRGYAFLDQGKLQLLQPDGTIVPVATGVTSASVAPGGERLAFAMQEAATPADRASEIDGYDIVLHTRYRLQVESEPVDGLTWSSDGQLLAYRLAAADPTRRQLRVRSLRDGGAVTVATGIVSEPAWQADRQHVLFTATVPAAGGPVTKAFRLSVSDGPHTLSAAGGMPAGQDLRVDQLSLSPDGHQVAFVADANGRPAVWTMNADGTGLTQLTDAAPDSFPYSSRAVAWTPS